MTGLRNFTIEAGIGQYGQGIIEVKNFGQKIINSLDHNVYSKGVIIGKVTNTKVAKAVMALTPWAIFIDIVLRPGIEKFSDNASIELLGRETGQWQVVVDFIHPSVPVTAGEIQSALSQPESIPPSALDQIELITAGRIPREMPPEMGDGKK